ncbi:class I SAM-dependent methyltransferase [Paludibacterium denitrificans]|uniref:Methyltransferase domain-containing protein n=1 Tax=Paludibacterium denitrificans TaxID=2675226 RepID=A0A844GE88_9NEIS|nr:class I SAM-dependent methyltransferase [Paludibacterium denitrificans]MTD32875.1 methyltransferase domain-containing protein [Paludibacterium denitrificans]
MSDVNPSIFVFNKYRILLTGPENYSMAHCFICNQAVAAWIPHQSISQRSEFSIMMRAVGSDLRVYQCPSCGCNDRDRHVWLYMNATGVVNEIPNLRILHIAPEPHLELLIQQLTPAAYIAGDLYPKKPDHQQLDVQALPFDDESFDLVICNHVLEHVSTPIQALTEFHRCLGPNGILIAQTPYSPFLKNTFEVNETVSPAFARLFFGQEDHVRLFGSDITAYFAQAGFKGELLDHDLILKGVDAEAFGVNQQEPFFVFTK